MKKLLGILVLISVVLITMGCEQPTSDPTPKPTYTVTFDTNGGSEVASVIVAEGLTVSMPSVPTKDGLFFCNWYKDTELTTKWAFETDTVMEDVTLYAKWTNTGTLNIMGYGDNADTEGQTFLRIVEAFEAENPDVEIEYELLFDEAYHQKVVERLASGEVPDVAYMGSDNRWGTPWSEAGQQADITPFIDASIFDTSKFGGADKTDGSFTYIPLGTGNYCTVMYTNDELIKSLGFDIPETYEDLVAMVPAAKKAGVEVLSTHGEDSWIWGSCYLSTAIAQTTGKADWPQQLIEGKVKFTDADAVAALKTLEIMVKDGVMSPEVVRLDHGTGKSNFAQGKALCYLDGQWAAGGYSAEIQETMGMHPIVTLPGAKGQIATLAAAKQVGYGLTQVAIDNGKADLGMKFIEFFNSEVEVEQRIRDSAVTGSVLTDHVLPTDLPRIAVLKNDLGSSTLTQVIDSFLTGYPNSILCTGAQEIVTGKKTAEQVAAAIDAEMQAD